MVCVCVFVCVLRLYLCFFMWGYILQDGELVWKSPPTRQLSREKRAEYESDIRERFYDDYIGQRRSECNLNKEWILHNGRCPHLPKVWIVLILWLGMPSISVQWVHVTVFTRWNVTVICAETPSLEALHGGGIVGKKCQLYLQKVCIDIFENLLMIELQLVWPKLSSGGFRGGKGGCKCTPLVASNVFLRT